MPFCTSERVRPRQSNLQGRACLTSCDSQDARNPGVASQPTRNYPRTVSAQVGTIKAVSDVMSVSPPICNSGKRTSAEPRPDTEPGIRPAASIREDREGACQTLSRTPIDHHCSSALLLRNTADPDRTPLHGSAALEFDAICRARERYLVRSAIEARPLGSAMRLLRQSGHEKGMLLFGQMIRGAYAQHMQPIVVWA